MWYSSIFLAEQKFVTASAHTSASSWTTPHKEISARLRMLTFSFSAESSTKAMHALMMSLWVERFQDRTALSSRHFGKAAPRPSCRNLLIKRPSCGVFLSTCLTSASLGFYRHCFLLLQPYSGNNQIYSNNPTHILEESNSSSAGTSSTPCPSACH